MIEIEARMGELEGLGLRRRTRLVSGPQGPRVILDGKPTLLLCSSNYLGLADHPRVREAAAEAAMRWGTGAGATRLGSGTMTIHRRLEDRLAAFLGRPSALLFGSGYLAGLGVVAALARPGDVVFADEQSAASLLDGCRLSGAELFLYDHLDAGHLRWGIAKAEGRGALIVTDSVFALDGELAPLHEILDVAERRRLRLVVDEGHAIGVLGDGGRGALAELGLEDQVDVIVGSLGQALASYGGFAACDSEMAEFLLNASRTLQLSAAASPPATAAALAALTLLEARPELATKLRSNAALLRGELERHGFTSGHVRSAILSIPLGDPELANEICAGTLRRGVLVEAICPPAVPAIESRVRLTVMASHRREELERAARALADASLDAGVEPHTVGFVLDEHDAEPESAADPEATQLFDVEFHARSSGIFDVEADERLAA